MGKTPSTNGKGDKRRPRFVSEDELAANWARIFGKRRAHNLSDESTPAIETDPSGTGSGSDPAGGLPPST